VAEGRDAGDLVLSSPPPARCQKVGRFRPVGNNIVAGLVQVRMISECKSYWPPPTLQWLQHGPRPFREPMPASTTAQFLRCRVMRWSVRPTVSASWTAAWTLPTRSIFGWDLQMRLRRQILERHSGELLVGAAEVVETGKMVPGLMIAAPTMRVPMRLPEDSVNSYLSTRAALLAARDGRLPDGNLASSRIKVLSVPAMGTGVGRISPKVCARQMRAAYDAVVISPAKLPTSWAEASHDHQLLYTRKPGRLQ